MNKIKNIQVNKSKPEKFVWKDDDIKIEDPEVVTFCHGLKLETSISKNI